MMPHKKYMTVAIGLAKKGGSRVVPNPKVGCVIVKRGQIVGRGYHREYGGPHAEKMALDEARHKARDSVLYVTLEPCSHWGKTAPCTEEIVKSGVQEVIIGMKDPNPNINGHEILKLRGIKVRMGILEDECKKMNEGYIKHVTKKLPFVTLKAGMTLDGKIATSTGKSKYITSKESLKAVHELRNELGTVMVGINTVLKDDPLLDTRYIDGGVEPTKIIVDSELKIPFDARVLKHPQTVIVACANTANKSKMKKLLEKKVRVIPIKKARNGIDMKELMKKISQLGYYNVLLEGGSLLNASMIKDNLVDKIMFFTSPKIIGDDAKGVIGPLGIKELDKVITLKEVSTQKVGKDILVEGYLE